MIQQMLAIWSLVPLPFLKLAWISGSSRFMYCWSLAWRILSIALLACGWAWLRDSLSVVWCCPSWDGSEHWPCPLSGIYLHTVVCIWQSQSPSLPLPLSFPLDNESLFSISVTIYVLQINSFVTFLKDFTYKWYHMIFVFLFSYLLPLWQPLGPSMMQMASFCSFLWLSDISLHIYVYIYIHAHCSIYIYSYICHIFFIHSSVDEYLGCLSILAILNSASWLLQWKNQIETCLPKNRVLYPPSFLSPERMDKNLNLASFTWGKKKERAKALCLGQLLCSC